MVSLKVHPPYTMSSGGDLFQSLSPLFWFLRLTGGTPFHHVASVSEILVFRWCHPQTLWFTFVTLIHLAFISAQVFGGLFTLSAKVDHPEDSPNQSVSNSTARYTNFISQIRFLIDTFLLSKLLHFNLAAFQKFFQGLNIVDRCVPLPFNAIKRSRKVIIIGSLCTFFWVLSFCYNFNTLGI